MDEQEIDARERIRRATIALSSRYTALAIYGFMALFIGGLMATTGGVGVVEDRFGPMSRVILGVPLAVAGVTLVIASFLGDERLWAWRAAVAGTALFGLWALALTITYINLGLDDGFVIAWPNERVSRLSARAYAVPLFGGLAVLQGLHLVTMLAIGRPLKRDR
jgi:hypothetical protein